MCDYELFLLYKSAATVLGILNLLLVLFIVSR